MKTVVALYANSTRSRDVVRVLLSEGFTKDEINVVENTEEGEIAGLVHDPTIPDIAVGERPRRDVTPEDLAGAGAVVGGVMGLLASIGMLMVPGIGPLLAAGPIAATLLGAGAGAVTGGLMGTLGNVGVSPEEAEYYAEGLRRGGAVVAVRTEDERAEQAREIMYRHAPLDMAETMGQWREEGWTGFHHGEDDAYFKEITDVLGTGALLGQGSPEMDREELHSVNVPDLDEDSRSFMTNLDSDTTGEVEPEPDAVADAFPDEERNPELTRGPRVHEAVERDGDVRITGVDPS